jgi:hypothetical protein
VRPLAIVLLEKVVEAGLLLQRYDQQVKEGCALPVYRSAVVEDTSKVTF